MNTADGARRQSSIKQKLRPRKGGSQKELEMTETNTQSEAHSEPGESASRFFSFTIDAETAQIVKFESLDAAGTRHEVTEDEKASFTKESTEEGLEDALEQAFEAGIACVLGESTVEQAGESEEDAELRHMLLTPLIEHSAARHLLGREALRRIILDTLIQHATKPEAEAVESSPNAEGIEEGRTAH
jgi:hypothetical protein